MNPLEAQAALDARTERIRAAAEAGDPAPLVRTARDIASVVRDSAGRNGHVISIRVIERPRGVRITVSGRHAARYRSLVEQKLNRAVPDHAAEIRSQITQKAR